MVKAPLPEQLANVSAPSATLAERRPDLADAADAFASASLSAATKRAVKADWLVWTAWCAAQGLQALPAGVDTAAGFMTDMAATKKVATLMRYRATIGKLHKLGGYSSPFADARVKAVIEGIRRSVGVAQTQKKALTIELAAADLGEGKRALRDRAALLLGVATSFRGDDLRRVDVEDLTRTDEGLTVHLRRSKMDQIGEGRVVGVPRVDDAPELCPVRAVESWIAARGDAPGPLFPGHSRDGRIARRTINAIVKRSVERAGIDGHDYGAHSLRSGYVTAARQAGKQWTEIMAQSGHKKLETVQRYDRGGKLDPFKASGVADVFKAAGERKRRRSDDGEK
jgi:integrase